MNADEANKIPLAQILDLVAAKPGKPLGRERAYLAPWRAEKTPSLHVNLDKNLWYDFGEGKGGRVVTFVCRYLEGTGEPHTVADALRWLRNMTGRTLRLPPVIRSQIPVPDKNTKLSLVKTVKIQHPALVDYLAARRIPLRLASRYLSEAWLYNRKTKRNSFALAFQNEEGGYELRNPYLKFSMKKKGISFVRGQEPKPEGIHLFEGVMDFLSALAFYRLDCFREDVIVFNSLALMDQATPLIRGYGYRIACSWLDNDVAGHKATQALAAFCASEPGLSHRPMNGLYHPHKDVNAWWMAPEKEGEGVTGTKPKAAVPMP